MPRGRRHFRRVPGRRSYRSLFVLAVEGTRTEPQYFSIFNAKRSVHVKVLTQPGGTDPFHVLKRMERYLSQERLKASDQAWLVVDKDHWTDEEREFVREMDERMPNLSIRNNADRTGKGRDGRLDGGYLRKFRRE